MLKNSVQSGLPVFDLDLTNQEHLLGDFNTILFNKSNTTVDIAIPFTFLGLSYFYASLSFEAQKAPNNYKAKLKGIEILDNRDKSLLFSFNFRNASENEINNHSQKFEENKKKDEKKKKEKAQNIENDFFSKLTQFNFTLPYDALLGFVEWTINFEKLKKELDVVKEFYTLYLNNNSEIWLEKTDEKAEEKNLPFVLPC